MKKIGEIPEEWRIVELGNISDEIYYGLTAKAVEKNTGIKMLRTTDIKDYSVNFDNLPFCEITEKRNNLYKYFLKKGDLIVARAGTVGVSVLIERDFRDTIFGSYLIKIRPKPELNPKFLHYFCQSNKYWLHLQGAQGSTLKNISLPLLKSFRFFIPPLTEQKKIAEILSTVDQAIEKVGEAIEKTQRLKKGLMQELLTKGMGHKEFKKTLIGKLPKVWDVKKLAEIGNLQYGYTASAIKKAEGIRFIRITDIDDNGKIKWESVPVCKIEQNNYEKYKLREDDILFARIGATTGKSALIDRKVKGVFASYLIRFVRNVGSLDSRYLYFFTQSNNYWLQVHKNKEGQLKKGINAKVLGNLSIPLPPLLEQQKIAAILAAVDKRIEALRNRKEKLEKVKKGLMEDLLTGRKRVILEA